MPHPAAPRVCPRPLRWLGMLVVLGLAWPQPAHAGLQLELPYSQDFDGLGDLDSGGFICLPADNRCAFQKNQNGTSNEYLLESGQSFSGRQSFRVVMDNVADPEAFRTEIQSHPPSDQFGEGDVLWVGYALRLSEDNPRDAKWFDVVSQLKLLNLAGTSDLCQIYLLAEKNDSRTFAIREEYSGCGGSSATYNTGLAATHGTWHRVALRVDLSHTGGFQLWMNQGDPSAPSFAQASNVFPAAVSGQKVFFKLGIYKPWFRSDIHPEDRVFAEWSYLFDDLRLCVEGKPPCETKAQALAWVQPVQASAPDAGQPGDSGHPPADAGPRADAGAPVALDGGSAPDASAPDAPNPPDAAAIPDAAGAPDAEARDAAGPQDADPPAPAAAGCGCGTGTDSALPQTIWAVVALLARRRRS